MKIFLVAILLLIVPFWGFSQQTVDFNISEKAGVIGEINGAEINVNENSINIIKNGNSVFSETLTGQKSIIYSNDKSYFAILNYAFPNDKSDYQIRAEIFNANSELVFTHNYNAPYDLPHQLFVLNNSGALISFNPIDISIKIVSGNDSSNIKLERNIPYQMERPAYLAADNQNVYLLTSLKALSIEQEFGNANIYKVDINSSGFIKKELTYSMPMAMIIENNDVVTSGVKFHNYQMEGLIQKFDKNLELQNTGSFAAEKIISSNGNYYCKYNNMIQKLDKNFQLIQKYVLPKDERITDILINGGELNALSQKSSEHNLLIFDQDLKLLTNQALSQSASAMHFIENASGKLLIKAENKTILIK